MTPTLQILTGDCRETLRAIADGSVNCCVTSPPYFGLRDYGVAGQIGMEQTPAEYVAQLVAVFAGVWRVLKDDGSLWLNLGDSYCSTDKWGGGKSGNTGKHTVTDGGDVASWAVRKRKPAIDGVKPKDLLGIPWRVAFALQAAGWYLREDIIWAKPNCMPESVTDRCTRSHEYIFHLSKSPRYYHDADAIKEPAIYAVTENASGSTTARKARAREEHKSMPTGGRNGIRPAGFKDARAFAGKHEDKQRGHSRRHDGFNDRWDGMEKAEQCSGMRNKRSVWTVAPANYPEAHFATFPPALILPCVLAGCPTGGTVLDPFGGSGTTGQVALENGRSAILCELNPAYVGLIEQRCRITTGLPLSA
jgi:DNA modification methylase